MGANNIVCPPSISWKQWGSCWDMVLPNLLKPQKLSFQRLFSLLPRAMFCQKAVFLNQITKGDPKEKHTNVPIQLSKALLVLPAVTKEPSFHGVCERREELFGNQTWVHGRVKEAGGIRPVSRFLFGPDYWDLHPASGTAYPKAVRMIWVSHRVIKT